MSSVSSVLSGWEVGEWVTVALGDADGDSVAMGSGPVAQAVSSALADNDKTSIQRVLFKLIRLLGGIVPDAVSVNQTKF